MPRGNPKTFTGVRLDPRLMAAVLERTNDLTAAIEEGLRLWLRRARRAGASASTAPPNPARRQKPGGGDT